MPAVALAQIAVGFLVGFLGSFIFRVPPAWRLGFSAAVAWSNAVGIPLTIVSSVSDQDVLRDGESTEDTMTLGIGLVGLYAMVFQITLWTIANPLMTHAGKLQAEAEKEMETREKSDMLTSASTSSSTANDGGSTESTTRLSLRRNHKVLASASLAASSDETVGDGDEAVPAWREMLGNVFSLPVIAACLGIVCAMIDPVRSQFVDGELSFLNSMLTTLGRAVVPLMLPLLGSNLSRPPVSGKSMPPTVILGLVVCRLFVMPALGIAGVVLLQETVTRHPMALFVLGVATVPPTATLIVLLSQVHGYISDQLPMAVFVQYMVALVTLPVGVFLLLFIIA